MTGSNSPDGWLSFAIAGAAGAIALGLVVGNDTLVLVAGLYGAEGSREASILIGWAVHVLHGVVFGVAFARLLDAVGSSGIESSWLRSTGWGLAYATTLWLVGWSLVGPVWLAAVTNFPADIPTWDVAALAGHVVYGLAIGPARVAIRTPPA